MKAPISTSNTIKPIFGKWGIILRKRAILVTGVTSISGLTYVTSGDVSGFDITTKTGTFMIAEDYAITTTSSSPLLSGCKVTL